LKATGIVRRIDDLGRVVVPKEIRRTLRIRDGDPLEIFVDREGEVILKKYSPIADLSTFANEYTDSLHEATGHIACVTDSDSIIAISGTAKKEFINKPIGPAVEQVLEKRQTVLINDSGNTKNSAVLNGDEDSSRFDAEVIAPIIAKGDPIGAVILLSKKNGVQMGDLEIKLAETAADFLAKQMEHH
jgi:AbrB family transcriptional regulator (stage V sporulation protein T)